MTVLKTPAEASVWCDRQRALGHSIGYVPTMGALHEGHLALVKRSVCDNNVTCASIFVNPLQFNNQDDFKKYPGSMDADIASLRSVECDMVYTGNLENFFPEMDNIKRFDTRHNPPVIPGLEADYRPGHLQGVAAIVERLFTTVGKCCAYFGEKDFQQTLLIKEIARNRGDIEVIVCPTVRDSTGLALSSRNDLLSDPARELAPKLYQALQAADIGWKNGERRARKLEQLIRESIPKSIIELEYAAVRDPDRWTADTPQWPLETAQALIAANLDGIRLIDNIRLGSSEVINQKVEFVPA